VVLFPKDSDSPSDAASLGLGQLDSAPRAWYGTLHVLILSSIPYVSNGTLLSFLFISLHA
jgi:hypothetical protein